MEPALRRAPRRRTARKLLNKFPRGVDFLYNVRMKRANSRSREILKALDADIRDGRYLAGRPFPSETALARRFDVSRSLMTGVLNELEQSGLVVRRQGRGTFVAARVCARKIGLVIPGIAVSDFFQPILGELSRLARTNDYEINFGEVYSSSHDRRVRQVRELAAEFIRQRIAGVLYEPLVGERAEEVNMRILRVLGRKGIPVVLLDSDIVPFPARSAYDVVGTNDVKAGAQIAAHLLSCRGVRSVHFHLPPDGPITYDNRIFGATALIRVKAPNAALAVLRSAADDVAALRRHLKAHGRPDAFVCMNDAVAAAFKGTLEAVGLRVPQDVLLTGFADLSVAALMTPPLTTIRQDRLAIARLAFRRLLLRIAEPDLPPCDFFLPAPLVVRRSTSRTASSARLRHA